MKGIKLTITVLLSFVFMIFLSSCAVVQTGADVLAGAGKISESDRDAIVKTSSALRSSFAEITEEEEYYIGRAVAALILSRYGVYDNKALTQYVNHVGKAAVFHSDRPETYAGYHFLVLDTEEVNALAAPSGFIFITKGLLERCRDEEMLSCVLAHEVGHVCAKHGLKSIKKARLIEAFKIIGEEAVQKYASEQLAKLTEIFEGALADIVEKLVERGYDRKYEYEADALAVRIAAKAGYSPRGLLNFLQTMIVDSSDLPGKGWFRTHPSADDRIKRVENEISSLEAVPEEEPLRTERYGQVMKNLK